MKLPSKKPSPASESSIAVFQRINSPLDVIHTPATARKAARLIPNSRLHDDVVQKRSDDNLLDEWDRKEWRDAEPRIAAIFAAFLRQAESAKQPA